MIIKNVLIYNEYKYFEEGSIYIKDGVFVEPFEEDDEIIDGQGCYAIPGLIDIHFHGCMGYDFCDGTQEALEKIAKYEASQGITTIVPATMTLPEPFLMHVMSNAGNYKNEKGAITTLGECNLGPVWNTGAKEGITLSLVGNRRKASLYANDVLVANEIDTAFLSSELAGGFVGCTYGPYTTTSDEADAPRIHFTDWVITYP